MPLLPGRPIGITLIVSVIAINGIASVAEAVALPLSGSGGAVAAFVSVLVGLLLVHRAYGLWTLQRSAWLSTVLVLCLRAVVGTLRLLAAPQNGVAWINLGLVALTLLYLIQPDVRALFSSDGRPGARSR